MKKIQTNWGVFKSVKTWTSFGSSFLGMIKKTQTIDYRKLSKKHTCVLNLINKWKSCPFIKYILKDRKYNQRK